MTNKNVQDKQNKFKTQVPNVLFICTLVSYGFVKKFQFNDSKLKHISIHRSPQWGPGAYTTPIDFYLMKKRFPSSQWNNIL